MPLSSSSHSHFLSEKWMAASSSGSLIIERNGCAVLCWSYWLSWVNSINSGSTRLLKEHRWWNDTEFALPSMFTDETENANLGGWHPCHSVTGCTHNATPHSAAGSVLLRVALRGNIALLPVGSPQAQRNEQRPTVQLEDPQTWVPSPTKRITLLQRGMACHHCYAS